MSGICSAHKEFMKGCMRCEAMIDDYIIEAIVSIVIFSAWLLIVFHLVR